jgi:hypothetical protein
MAISRVFMGFLALRGVVLRGDAVRRCAERSAAKWCGAESPKQILALRCDVKRCGAERRAAPLSKHPPPSAGRRGRRGQRGLGELVGHGFDGEH